MFLASYEPYSRENEGSILNNFAFLYDNALVAMALSYSNQHERAQQIAEAIVYAYQHDRFYQDGRLRNAYSSGSLKSFPGWYSSRGTEFARLPGFYKPEENKWYEDKNAVSTSTGNMAWTILALLEVDKHASKPNDYLETAQGIAKFVLTLKSPNGAGFTGGYEGWEPDPKKATYLSTEHNIDLITVFAKLHEITANPEYLEASQSAKEFVLSMFDPQRGCFYTGTTPDGITINPDPLPLDTNSWALLALKDDFSDTAKVLSFIENNLKVEGGYDFNSDQDGIWLEGTAQVAVVYKMLGMEEKYQEILAYLESQALPDGSIRSADRDGVTTGFMASGTDQPWLYNKRVHIGATAWLAFAQMGINPL
jgi:hypothetical protein